MYQNSKMFTLNRELTVLYVCVFLIMLGFGVSLPALTFHTERVMLTLGSSTTAVVSTQVGLITATYPLMQLIFAPVWGKWSDRIGRKPLVMFGIVGFAAGQLVFGLAGSLAVLYFGRILGGVASAAILPAATAYVSDLTTPERRSLGMAWLGASSSLGVVFGPTLGSVLAQGDVHFRVSFGHFLLDRFSIPFLFAFALALLTLPVARVCLPESGSSQPAAAGRPVTEFAINRRKLKWLLGVTLGSWFGLTLFEGTFALYAKTVLNFGIWEVGLAFGLCGLVMALFQAVGVGLLSGYLKETDQIILGLALMGGALVSFSLAHSTALLLTIISVLALGMALVSPNVYSETSKLDESRRGSLLGLQNSAGSLGQFAGPAAGGVLFAWETRAPYLLGGLLLIGLAALMTLTRHRREPEPDE